MKHQSLSSLVLSNYNIGSQQNSQIASEQIKEPESSTKSLISLSLAALCAMKKCWHISSKVYSENSSTKRRCRKTKSYTCGSSTYNADILKSTDVSMGRSCSYCLLHPEPIPNSTLTAKQTPYSMYMIQNLILHFSEYLVLCAIPINDSKDLRKNFKPKLTFGIFFVWDPAYHSEPLKQLKTQFLATQPLKKLVIYFNPILIEYSEQSESMNQYPSCYCSINSSSCSTGTKNLFYNNSSKSPSTSAFIVNIKDAIIQTDIMVLQKNHSRRLIPNTLSMLYILSGDRPREKARENLVRTVIHWKFNHGSQPSLPTTIISYSEDGPKNTLLITSSGNTLSPLEAGTQVKLDEYGDVN
ncbi:hypothetical protein Tco_1500362 [Tanacetum coccineum]